MGPGLIASAGLCKKNSAAVKRLATAKATAIKRAVEVPEINRLFSKPVTAHNLKPWRAKTEFNTMSSGLVGLSAAH